MTGFDFWHDFGNSFALPITSLYRGFQGAGQFTNKVIDIADRVGTSSGQIISATGDIAGGISSIISGRSNLFLYAGIAVIAVIVLPKLVDKLL